MLRVTGGSETSVPAEGETPSERVRRGAPKLGARGRQRKTEVNRCGGMDYVTGAGVTKAQGNPMDTEENTADEVLAAVGVPIPAKVTAKH